MNFNELILAMDHERLRQIKKHNLPKWHDLDAGVDWLAVLSEEFGEVAEAVMAERFGNKIDGRQLDEREIKELLRSELIQLITVAGAWACDEE